MKNYVSIPLLTLFVLSCLPKEKIPEKYSNLSKIIKHTSLNFEEHTHLKAKKIFIDPGHGGYGKKDMFRMGPGGLTEEAVNLRVALILSEMLKQSGADIRLSREKDIMLGLEERVQMVKQFEPQLFLSVHHNGSLRSIDGINYPCVLFWGNMENNPAGYGFARMLNKAMSRTMQIDGHIISDYTTFWETGTRVLRKTRNICPGALGEFGFFSDKDFEAKLKDFSFNVKEAETYFRVISKYFKQGVPYARIYLTTPRKLVNKRYRFLAKRSTAVYIKIDGGTEKPGIKKNSLTVKINMQTVNVIKVSHNTYKVNFGHRLTPGLYRIQFSFKNSNNQSSMKYVSEFSVGLKKNEFDTLVNNSFKQIENKNFRKGLSTLLPLYFYCTHEPVGDKVAYYIARAFEKSGDRENAAYFYSRVYHFYPQSRYRERIKHPYITDPRFKVDNYGKPLPIKYLPTEKEIIKDTMKH